MTRIVSCVAAIVVVAALSPLPAFTQPPASESLRSANSGWLSDPNVFPIAVWLQNPSRAAEYRDAGINLYVALWRGPTDEQLAELKLHDMRVICDQNDVALQHLDDPTIVAWMHGDEPDNAQPLRGREGYGPPTPPSEIVDDYNQLKQRDPSRPILLNLGQGVAWDGWYGRGVRTNHPEDYPEYVQGADIVSFDIYPAVHDHADVAGKLWMVADGVTRLREWTSGEKPVWNCIECTHISNPDAKATPRQVTAEVWMSLIRGSSGIIYFVHQFEPEFIEAALLSDPDMVAQVRATNQQIQSLAPVLHSPTISDAAHVESASQDVPVECMLKRHDGNTYLFTVAMRPGTTTATFQINDHSGTAFVEVLGENRRIPIAEGTFKDSFNDWAVHLYRIPQQ